MPKRPVVTPARMSMAELNRIEKGECIYVIVQVRRGPSQYAVRDEMLFPLVRLPYGMRCS